MGITFLADLVGFFVGYVSQFLDYIVHVVFCPADPDLAKDKAMFLAKGHAVVNLGIIHKPADLALSRVMAQWAFRAGYFPVLHGFFPGIKFTGHIFIVSRVGYVDLFPFTLRVLVYVQGLVRKNVLVFYFLENTCGVISISQSAVKVHFLLYAHFICGKFQGTALVVFLVADGK